MLDTQTGQRLKNIFDGYLSLQGETYEFISRAIAMDKSLKNAHSLYQENPHFQADQLYKAWQPILNAEYRNLFAVFLRPYQMVAFPFGDFSATKPSCSRTASASLPPDDSPFSMWSEAGMRFIKGFTEAAGGGSGLRGSPAQTPGRQINGILDTTPLNLVGQTVDGQMRAYFEAARQFCGLLGENEFLFPKSLVLHLQRVCDTYPKVYPLAQRFEAMLWDTWEKGLEKLADQMAGQTGPRDFKTFLDAYVKLMSGEYHELLSSREFMEVQNNYTQAISDLVVSLRKAIEARLELFPFLPFVATSEMIALEKTVHNQKRQIGALERRLAELEDRLGAPA